MGILIWRNAYINRKSLKAREYKDSQIPELTEFILNKARKHNRL